MAAAAVVVMAAVVDTLVAVGILAAVGILRVADTEADSAAIRATAVIGAEEDGAAAGWWAAGEQASTRPDIAASKHSRGKAMGPDTSR